MESEQKSKDIKIPIIIANGPMDTLHLYALVLSAVGIGHRIDPATETLTVEREDVQAALNQLHTYREENRNWPPKNEAVQPPLFSYSGVTLILICLLILFFFHSGGWYPENPWFTVGAVDRNLIFIQDQWWRIVTALTLHADLVHLAGNSLIGGHMISFLSRTVGYGLCWFLVVFCGAAGNFMNILFREQQHLSVGFSTAVFATIGIFTGLAIGSRKKQALRRYIAPIGAGLGLLVFLGSEGERTDIGAHFFGFVIGIIVGICTNLFGLTKRFAQARSQFTLLLAAIGLVLFSWLAAIRAYPDLHF